MDKELLRARHSEVLAERRAIISQQIAVFAGMSDVRLTFEVGCGHGHFLNAYAVTHPEKVCVGVDIESNRIERAEKKRDRARLANLHFIRADARLFLEALPAGARLETVFVLFPDPWPKLRHHKHRILQTAFLADLRRHAAPGCRLYFRTDFRPYHLEARRTLESDPHWRLLPDAPWIFEHATVFQNRAESHDSLVAEIRNHDH